MSIASAVVFGLGPALKASRAEIAPNLKQGTELGGRSGSAAF